MCLLATGVIQRHCVPGLFMFCLSKYSHFYFLLSPPNSLPPSSCNLNTLCVNQWALWERKSGRMGMSAPCSPVSCLSPGFCLSSLHLSYKTPDLSLAYYLHNHQKDNAINYRLKMQVARTRELSG